MSRSVRDPNYRQDRKFETREAARMKNSDSSPIFDEVCALYPELEWFEEYDIEAVYTMQSRDPVHFYSIPSLTTTD